jgi:DNA-binding CsgD family transcriptional regulator
VARTDVWARDVQLNDREVETLTWVARGKRSVEIAEILNLAKRTVDVRVDNACNKLGVDTNPGPPLRQ